MIILSHGVTGLKPNIKQWCRTLSTMIRLFEGSEHAKSYAQYRPTYPSEVYDKIVEFCHQRGAGRSLALDVACGSGQSTLPLRSHFDKVVGCDISQAQIGQAPTEHDNVTFRVGSAEDVSFQDKSSVDLITCAQGTHWLDRSLFFKEAERILKPNGVLALYGYGNVKLDRQDASDAVWKVSH